MFIPIGILNRENTLSIGDKFIELNDISSDFEAL